MSFITKENLFNLETYDYSLPNELIAQYPCKKRDHSKLLCYNRKTKKISHHVFYELADKLSENDVLVLNNTKVIPARFYGNMEPGPETRDQRSEISPKKVEIILVHPITKDNLTWEVLARPQKYLRKHSAISIPAPMERGSLSKAEWQHSVISIDIINEKTIKFRSHNDLKIILNEIGQMPLPPYIKRDYKNIETIGTYDYKNDVERYQTVFAEKEGAVAAPTAALHFTNDLLEKLKNKGVEIYFITLHVGPGTFLPIRTDDIREHKLMPEQFSVEKNTWEKILNAKEKGKRIIACGTTVVRTLEHLANEHSAVNSQQSLSGLNNLFITPDYKFKFVDSIITNFHLPKTSLLLLVSTFAGLENIRNIYNEAIKEKYRFFSYGDVMFIE